MSIGHSYGCSSGSCVWVDWGFGDFQSLKTTPGEHPQQPIEPSQLGLACESTDLAPISTCTAACATSAPVPTAMREPRPVFMFVFASRAAARLSEFEDSERFMLGPNEGTAAEHAPPFGQCMFSELNRWRAGRRRTDSPS